MTHIFTESRTKYNLAFVPQTSEGKTTSSVLIPGARAHNTDHLYLWPRGLALSHTHSVLIGGTCQICKLCLDACRNHDGKPCLTKSCGAAEDDISAFFLGEKQWSERVVYREGEDTRLHPPVWDQFCFSCNPRQRLAQSHEDSAQTLSELCGTPPHRTPPHQMSWRTKSCFWTTSNFSSHRDENTLSVLLRFRRVLLEAVIFTAGSEKYEI